MFNSWSQKIFNVSYDRFAVENDMVDNAKLQYGLYDSPLCVPASQHLLYGRSNRTT